MVVSALYQYNYNSNYVFNIMNSIHIHTVLTIALLWIKLNNLFWVYMII